MKKKIFIYLLIAFFLLVGCSKKETKTEKDKEEKFEKLSGYRQVSIKCDAIKDLSDFNYYNGLFITKDGKLYRTSFNKLFSNDTNCLQIESDKTFTRFIRGGILDSENNLYVYDHENNNIKLYDYEDWNITMPNGLRNIPKDKYKNVIYSDTDMAYGDNQMYYFYYDKEKKEIYNFIGDTSAISDTPLFKLNEDEKLEYITYGGIETNKALYTYDRKATNKDKCEKYEDIQCIYESGFYEANIEELEHIKYIQIYGSGTDITYFILDENNNFYTNY